jgi:hypothetical protein
MIEGARATSKNGEQSSKVVQFPDVLNSIELGIQWQNQALLKQLVEQVVSLSKEIDNLKGSPKVPTVGKKTSGVLTEEEFNHKITRIELASRWKVSIQTLKRREKDGVLKPLLLGGCVRYDVVDILKTEEEAKVTYA